MALVRMLVSWGAAADPVEDRLSNTLYFNVSGSVDDPDYQDLANDLRDIYAGSVFTVGGKIEVRAYDMADAKPRPERAFASIQRTGTFGQDARQMAVALSYYADRNLPRRRGRIFLGPVTANTPYIAPSLRENVIAFAQQLAGLGGLNVDWSVYSPTTAASGGEAHFRISNVWVDNGWDVIRSRKLKGTARSTATING